MRKLNLFISLLMLLTFSIGQVWAAEASYTIDLKPTTTNTNSSVSASDFKTKCVTAGGDYISSCTTSTKIYQNGGFIKLGSSSGVGTFTLSLSEAGQVKATKIVVSAKQYSSTEKTLKITCSANTTGASFSNLESSFKDRELTLNGENAITSITVGTTSKRGYVESITVYYEAASPTKPTGFLEPLLHVFAHINKSMFVLCF